MANISNTVNVHDGAAVTNWISQINAGGQVYDIATHHNIIFKDGSKDTTGVKWNGLTDIEVVIPSITDIVQSPIVFAGTVDSDGIHYDATHQDGPQTGYLVFVTADCTFEGFACEAGDMAIYDGTKWNIVSGENQVTITGTTNDNIDSANRITVAIGAAKDVLEVEGKALSLTLDYVDLDGHVSVSKTIGSEVSVAFGDITVDAVNLKLNQADGETKTIGEDKTFKNATALANGTVTLVNADSLVKSVDFGTFTQGTLPTFTSNSEKKLAVAGGTLDAIEGSDFVKSVSLADVTFKIADETDENKITMVTGINSAVGASFLNGVHSTGDTEDADITIAGSYAPTNGASTTFVEGLVSGSKVLTSFTSGSFNLTAGDSLVTGFAEGSDEVIDTVTATANNDTDVFNSASVSDHVLSFGTTKVASGVNVTTTTKKLQLTKTGFQYTPSSVTESEFVTSGFTKAADVKYTFDKGNETVYTTDKAMWKLDTPDLAVTTGAYSINHTNMKATIDAGSFVASVTEGTLPTWTGYSAPTVEVTGTVGTALAGEDVTIKGLISDSIALPGAYSLTSVETGGDVTVGASGASVNANATVDLTEYLKDVDVNIVNDIA